MSIFQVQKRKEDRVRHHDHYEPFGAYSSLEEAKSKIGESKQTSEGYEYRICKMEYIYEVNE